MFLQSKIVMSHFFVSSSGVESWSHEASSTDLWGGLGAPPLGLSCLVNGWKLQGMLSRVRVEFMISEERETNRLK